jgi:aminobenzoyl-glutamate utilization protein B
MIFAAKVLALGALAFMTDPELLRQAREEFDARMAETPYQPPMPDDVKPPIGS